MVSYRTGGPPVFLSNGDPAVIYKKWVLTSYFCKLFPFLTIFYPLSTCISIYFLDSPAKV